MKSSRVPTSDSTVRAVTSNEVVDTFNATKLITKVKICVSKLIKVSGNNLPRRPRQQNHSVNVELS